MRYRWSYIPLSLAMIVGGCTSIQSYRDVIVVAEDEAVLGAPYALAMLQYDIKVTRSLVQCVDPATGADAAKFALSVEATPRYIAGERFIADYRKLAGFTKISSSLLQTDKDTGILTSFNLAAEDRSEQVIGNFVKTTVGITSLAAGVPLPTGAKQLDGTIAVSRYALVCNNDGKQAFNEVAVAGGKVKLDTDKLKKATSSVEALANRGTLLSDADKSALTRLVAVQQAAAQSLSSSQGRLDDAKQSLGVVSQLSWPTDPREIGTSFAPQPWELRKVLRFIGSKPVADKAPEAANQCVSGKDIGECAREMLSIYVALDPLVKLRARALPPPPPPPPADAVASSRGVPVSEMLAASIPERSAMLIKVTGRPADGLFVRTPVAGRLLVCGNSEQGGCTADGNELLLRGDAVQVTQLGTLRFLPFRNKMFQNNVISVDLTTSGIITKLEYKALKAPGEGASATALAAVQSAGEFGDSREADRAADRKNAQAAETSNLQHRIAVAKSQNELTALNSPGAAATAGVEADTIAVNARVALWKAQLAEREAVAALQAPQ